MDCALQLLQVIYNFAHSDKFIEGDDQREQLTKDLYSLLQPLYNDEDAEEDGVRTSERTNMTCADLLPPNLIEATLSTLKLCLNGKEKLQEIIARKL